MGIITKQSKEVERMDCTVIMDALECPRGEDSFNLRFIGMIKDYCETPRELYDLDDRFNDEVVIDYINNKSEEPRDVTYMFIQDEELGLVIQEACSEKVLVSLTEIFKYTEDREND